MACHPGLAAVPVSRGRDHSNRFLSSQSRTSSASTDDLTGGARRSGIFRHGIALAAASMTSAPAFGVAARSDVRWVELCSGRSGEKQRLPIDPSGPEDDRGTGVCHFVCAMPKRGDERKSHRR